VFDAKLFTLAFFDLHLWENETAATEFQMLVAHVRAAAVERQYLSEKTRTFVSRSSAPELKSRRSACLCDANVATSRLTEPISATVMMALFTIPKT
jgi:hypothetical protein